MSSISAGTSSGTALVQSGDTTGALVIKTGGSAATAATFNADQSVTLAQPLPVASGGTGATSLSGITVGTATSATTATNLSGGSGGTIPYQTSSGTTAMLAAGTSGYLLQSNGTSAPSWTPAPASAGTVTAVASGSLSDGSAVILNSDGTVSVVAASSASVSTYISRSSAESSVTTYSATYQSVAGSFDPSTNTIVLFYLTSSDGGYLWSIAGTVSGASITWGTTAVNVFAAPVTWVIEYGFSAVFVPSAGHVVFFSRNSDGYIVSRMVTTSGVGTGITPTVVSGGSQTIFGSSDSYCGPSAVYDSTSGKVVVAAYDVSATFVNVCTVTVTSTTITANTPTTPLGGGGYHTPAICVDPTDNKILLLGEGSSSSIYAAVGTISGTSISFGSPTLIATSGADKNTYAIAYSVADSKVFAMYGLSGSTTPRGVVGTVSGTTITFGTPQTFGYSYGTYAPFSAVYYSTTGKIFVAQSYVQYRIDISGTTFTAANESYYSGVLYGKLAYLDGADVLLMIGSNYSGGYYPGAMGATAYTSNLTSSNFLGFSSAAYTNGQTATINTVGSTITNQSGLTTASKYYVSANGSLSGNPAQPYAGLAMSATKLVVKG